MYLDPKNVNTLEDLLKFIEALRKDFDENKADWNADIPSYLEAMGAGIHDHAKLNNSDSGFKDQMNLANVNAYQGIAEALLIGKIYE